MTELPPETHLGGVHLGVSDLERSLKFYRDLLQFQVLEKGASLVYLSASGGLPFHLLLEELADARPKPPRTAGLYHVAIRYPDRRSLAVALRRLLERNWPLQGAADHGVSEAIYLPDPDGLGIELYTDRPPADWPRLGKKIAMGTEPLDLEDLLRQAGKDRGGDLALDPHTDIGHVHLQVGDLATQGVFYNQHLGFDITQQDYPGALFLAAGGYHHHIGLNIWAGRGAPPPPPQAVGLRAFSVVLPAESALESRRAILVAAGHRMEEREWSPASAAPVVQDPGGIGVVLAVGA